MRQGALSDLRVLDLSRVLAGPSVTQILADFGADVVKVERIGSGDESRTQGVRPKPRAGANNEDTSGYTAVNRGKRSIALDLSHPSGQEIVRRLCVECDVLVENFKTGDLERYGLDYTSLSKLNPRLIYCSITGFGQTGPYSRLPGYDLIFQAMSGVIAATGGDDAAAGGPQRVGYAISDATAGLYATIGILAALHHRVAHSGKGQHIDLALLDAQIAAMTIVPASYLAAGQVPKRVGLSSSISCPYQAFKCSDGLLVVAVNNSRQFSALCNALDLSELVNDQRFADNLSRVQHREVLLPPLERAMQTMGVNHWRKKLSQAGVPCGPVNDIGQAFEDEQVKHRGMQQQVVHPLKGSTAIVANPLKLSATPVAYKLAPPSLGEHSEDILRDLLGMDGLEIELLVKDGIVGVSPGKTARGESA